MKAVVRVGPGIVEVNYMWLPSWIGMNGALLREIGEHVQPLAMNKPLDDTTLQELHEAVVDFICMRFASIDGLRAFLDGLLNVGIAGSSDGPDQG